MRFFQIGGFGRIVVELAAGLRKLNTRDTVAAMPMTDTGLVAANTRTNVVRAILPGFNGELWVADKRANHADHVCLTAGNRVFGLVWLIDSPGRENRHGYDLRMASA